MGAEQRAKQIGKYNVCVTLLILRQDQYIKEPINCRSWEHAGNYLALDLFDGTMRIICLNQYHSFIISPLEEAQGGEVKN